MSVETSAQSKGQLVRQVHLASDRERALLEILRAISSSRDDNLPVFDVVLQNAARLCNAPMARLLLVNAERSHYRSAASWGKDIKDPMPGNLVELDPILGTSLSILENRVVIQPDLFEGEGYKKGHPHSRRMADQEGLRSILCVPLVQGEEAIGCIALSSRDVAAFGSVDVSLVEMFAAQAVIAIENVRQFKELEALNAELGDRVEEQVGEIERMGRLKRFLPAAVADTVISQGADKLLSSHRALLGVLFCDIRGFTAFCETAEPEETIEVLQTYHEEMGKLMAEHGAGVDHRMGDGIMVLFNDPLPCDDPAGDAVRLAISMRARMKDLGKKWKRLGHRLGFGVGVSLGYATVGMVGYEGRYDYTASGTAVNLAARLCDQAEDGDILLSPRAFTAIEDGFAAQSNGEVSLKGIHAPVEVFRLVDAPE